ncbi:hypothetical protein JW898_02565 [Candidatus Woesearchaeota archaeon]|nr:hypothetical protein [Candidatus Woesearchaeota archaeon]
MGKKGMMPMQSALIPFYPFNNPDAVGIVFMGVFPLFYQMMWLFLFIDIALLYKVFIRVLGLYMRYETHEQEMEKDECV